ncbi:hypothetical protein BX600DRAFT_13021 [Xylariales sp. PMI_506]|nr:hypothetical protein BX600DRAFT_13021 [Xylariales sp. PMI_506]
MSQHPVPPTSGEGLWKYIKLPYPCFRPSPIGCSALISHNIPFGLVSCKPPPTPLGSGLWYLRQAGESFPPPPASKFLSPLPGWAQMHAS